MMENQLNVGRNQNLDLVKVFACIAVVGLHTLHKDISVINSTLYYLCGFAVPVFFVASGYVLLNRKEIALKYIISKIASVMRLVICWSVIAFFAKLVLDWLSKDLTDYSLVSLPKLIVNTLLQRDVLWHFWYFGALMIVYACSPLLSKAKKYLKLIWLGLVGVSCIIQILSYVVGTPLQSRCIQTFRIWTWLQYFILGGLLGSDSLTRGLGKIKITMKMHTVCLLLITLWIAIFQNIAGRYWLHNSYAEFFYDSPSMMIWVIMLFTWVLRLPLSEKVIEIIKKVAPLTLGIYILHPLIMRIIGSFIKIHSFGMSLMYFIAILLLSVIAAEVVSRIPIVKRLIEL